MGCPGSQTPGRTFTTRSDTVLDPPSPPLPPTPPVPPLVLLLVLRALPLLGVWLPAPPEGSSTKSSRGRSFSNLQKRAK